MAYVTEDEVMYGFRELRPVAGYCRFRDCRHEQEPGCAIRDAVEKGDVREDRFASYKRILQTLTEL